MAARGLSIMKSPLKYLAGLMGRGRAAEPLQVLISQDPQPKHLAEAQATLEASVSALALPSATDATPPHTADLPSAPAPIEDDTVLDAGAPDLAPAALGNVTPLDTSDIPWPDDTAVALASRSPVKSPAKTRAKRISQEKPALTTEASADLLSHDDVHVAPPVLSVSDEVVSLDDEITALRKQLAQKLKLQNSQLKKMLERFDRF
jgi:hypothetical protein